MAVTVSTPPYELGAFMTCCQEEAVFEYCSLKYTGCINREGLQLEGQTVMYTFLALHTEKETKPKLLG